MGSISLLSTHLMYISDDELYRVQPSTVIYSLMPSKYTIILLRIVKIEEQEGESLVIGVNYNKLYNTS